MLWRGARSFGSEADVFTSNWPTGAAAAAARAQGATACQLRCCHPGRTCCKQCQTWEGHSSRRLHAHTLVLQSSSQLAAARPASTPGRTPASRLLTGLPAARRLAGCSQAGRLLTGWQAAQGGRRAQAGRLPAGWPAAHGLAGCSRGARRAQARTARPPSSTGTGAPRTRPSRTTCAWTSTTWPHAWTTS